MACAHSLYLTCKVARSYSLDLGSSSLAITTGWQGHGSNPVVVGSTPDSTEEELFVLCHEIKNDSVRLIFLDSGFQISRHGNKTLM